MFIAAALVAGPSYSTNKLSCAAGYTPISTYTFEAIFPGKKSQVYH